DPICDGFDTVEALATEIDRRIADGIQPYPTYVESENRLTGVENVDGLRGKVAHAFEETFAQLPEDQRPFFLLQYANQIRNKREMLEGGEE
ncbi:MAG: hypothetical protein VYC86_03940, partial [Pseudomonadota bacterium]|nr:hypothetical protein [Pseudomonadota bacterium]